MSVMTGWRVSVDPGRFEEVVNSNRERILAISWRELNTPDKF